MLTKTYKRVLTIAGSDSGGGAGIQADIKTISALGGYATSAITCITAQNTVGVQAIEQISPQIIKAQIESVLSDIGADAIKIGMLGSPAIAQAVADALRGFRAPIVLDPVLVATSGDTLTEQTTIDIILNELMPIVALITPNLEEAKQLTGACDDSAWEILRSKGAAALLLKGGHGTSNTLTDSLFMDKGVLRFENERIDTINTHGTGCSLSSAIATFMAHGQPLEEAVAGAIKYVHKAIATAAEYKLGKGHGAIHHFYRYW